jgi:hypothetical protein
MKKGNLEKQIETYAALAKEDKNIDVASLMIHALDSNSKDADMLSAGQKRWAYIIALGAPPFGLFFALKFWFSGKDDGQDAALICVVLTAVSVMILVILTKVLFSGGSAQLDQIQQIKPQDVRQLYE